MTSSESPTSGELMRAIGRVEKTIEGVDSRLGSKIDQVDDKLDGHAGHLIRHDGEISGLRRDLDNLAELLRTTAQQRSGGRIAIASALAGGVSGAVIGGLLQLLSLHH